MSDLISRSDAIEAVCSDCTIENRESCKRDGYCYEVRNLMALPSAEAEWIESRYVCTCSHCGYLVELKTPFCPNCGAKMKGEFK